MTEENKTNNQQETASTSTPAEVLSSLKGFGDIDLNFKVLLGSIKMPIGQYLKITRGSIVELGKGRAEPLDVLVNGRKVAEGEVVLSKDMTAEKIGIEITKVFKPKKF
jgi:flagellar motor switch protein FliN/FliY